MNKLFSVLCVLALMLTNFTFAQYGGGSTRSGGSSSSLVKDVCPDGDTSGSYFDGTCGDAMVDDTTTDEPMVDDTTDEPMVDDTTTDDTAPTTAGTSLFDLLKNRGSSTSTPDSTSGAGADGAGGFVLPGMLAATGADPRAE